MDELSVGKSGLAYFWSKLKPLLNAKANQSDLSKVATSGNYDDLIGMPDAFPPANHRHVASDIDITVPKKLSELENDAGFVTTSGSVAQATKALQDGAGRTITETYFTKTEASTIETVLASI